MTDLIPYEEAVERALALINPTETEVVSPEEAFGRVLSEPLEAKLTQPPFDASAMDGIAVRASDVTTLPVTLRLTGESAAGNPFSGIVAPGEAVRIFTGASVPDGADCVIIQENCDFMPGMVTVNDGDTVPGQYIRSAGTDFHEGRTVPEATELTVRMVSLLAAMNHTRIPVHRRPRVAVIATGDEILLPGSTPGPGQIISSNHIALSGLIRLAGGEPVFRGIAADRATDVSASLNGAQDVDLIITTGGASVGDHDLVVPCLKQLGADVDFWRIAMQPGKPLLIAQLGKTPVIGLPGNPVSSLITGLLFVRPMVRKLAGLPADPLRGITAQLTTGLAATAQRHQFLRAILNSTEVTPVDSQDSSLLTRLADANCLISRPPRSPAAAAGQTVSILMFPEGPLTF